MMTREKIKINDTEYNYMYNIVAADLLQIVVQRHASELVTDKIVDAILHEYAAKNIYFDEIELVRSDFTYYTVETVFLKH